MSCQVAAMKPSVHGGRVKVQLINVVSVRYPHKQNGLAGKVSNSTKIDTMKDFLDFVNTNSQPNGRCSDSHCPTHYLLPNFTTIQTPKTNIGNYEQRFAMSLAGEFNRVKREHSKPTISNFLASTWFKACCLPL